MSSKGQCATSASVVCMSRRRTLDLNLAIRLSLDAVDLGRSYVYGIVVSRSGKRHGIEFQDKQNHDIKLL